VDARIWVSAGGAAPRSVPLAGQRTVVGRSPEADLTLEDDAVSWNHLEIERRPGGCFESRLLDFHLIHPRIQRRNGVHAFFVGDDVAHAVRAGIANRDGRSGHRGPGSVFHLAGDGA